MEFLSQEGQKWANAWDRRMRFVSEQVANDLFVHRPAHHFKKEADMNIDDAIKAFESPRPNGWFRDDEVKVALEALREKRERERPVVKRPSLEEMEKAVRDAATEFDGCRSDAATKARSVLIAAADLIRAVREEMHLRQLRVGPGRLGQGPSPLLGT